MWKNAKLPTMKNVAAILISVVFSSGAMVPSYRGLRNDLTE
jgi:hypothetical protein